ncbi:hypothetical protein, partial [Victivallis sp.]
FPVDIISPFKYNVKENKKERLYHAGIASGFQFHVGNSGISGDNKSIRLSGVEKLPADFG